MLPESINSQYTNEETIDPRCRLIELLKGIPVDTTDIKLHNKGIEEIPPGVFANYSKLGHLDLEYNQISVVNKKLV